MESQKSEDEDKIKVKYPSAKILLETAKKEYDVENDRKKNLETRTGVFMSLSSALLIFIMREVTLLKINLNEFVTVWFGFFLSLSALLGIILVVLLLRSIYFFIKVISVSEYKRINLEELLNITLKPEDIFSQVVIIRYRQIIEINRKENDKKVDFFSKGINNIQAALYCLVSFGLLILLISSSYIGR